jgi:hypothetical protein
LLKKSFGKKIHNKLATGQLVRRSTGPEGKKRSTALVRSTHFVRARNGLKTDKFKIVFAEIPYNLTKEETPKRKKIIRLGFSLPDQQLPADKQLPDNLIVCHQI